MTDHFSIQDNDVLCGRGGATNNHVGNKRFRALVADHQPEYLAAKKRDKSAIARTIVKLIRGRGGRFLKKKDEKTWVDVGDKKASEKTSQALREGLFVRSQTIKEKTPQGSSAQLASSSATEPPAKKQRVERQTPPVSAAALGESFLTDELTSSNVGEFGSPSLVSEFGVPCVLPPLGEDGFSRAHFVHDPPQISTADCSDVVPV